MALPFQLPVDYSDFISQFKSPSPTLSFLSQEGEDYLSSLGIHKCSERKDEDWEEDAENGAEFIHHADTLIEAIR